MKKAILPAAIMVAFVSTPVHAKNKALPLGIDLGTTTCTDIYKSKKNTWNLQAPAMSTWSKGIILQSSYPSIDAFENGKDLFIICDEEDKSIYVSITIAKRSAQEIADQLSKKYTQIQRNLPRLGNGRALWKASNANIKIQYVHVSFDATLNYETAKAKTMYAKYQQEQERMKQQETASQL